MSHADIDRKNFQESLRRCIHKTCVSDESIQSVPTPYSLCKDILSKLDENIDLSNSNVDILVMFNVEFVHTLIEEYGVEPNNITFISDSKIRNVIAGRLGAVAQLFKIENLIESIKKGVSIMNKQFMVVLGNPPYQSKNKGEKKTHPLWHMFVEMSISLCRQNGFISLIHPSGWRNVDGKFKKVQKALRSIQMIYLEMKHFREGQKVFGVAIDFDWYCAKNTENNNFLTTIKFQDGVVKKDVDISNLEFIPSKMFDNVMSLVAKNGEEKVQIINNSSYHHQRPYMSKEKNSDHPYPCVYTVRSNNEPTFYWSSLRDKGHYGISKVVWGTGASGVFVDSKGEYGLTEYASAIIDDVENLENIKKALTTKKFIENIMGFEHSLGDKYNRKIIAILRKDFWKEFINV